MLLCKKSLLITLILFPLFFSANKSTAQNINTIIIDSPKGIAGNYQIYPAVFGDVLTVELSAECTFVNDEIEPITDACQVPNLSINDRIAFMDIGTCSYGEKALNAENAGAILAIICNTEINGGPIFNMGGGTIGNQVSIPVFSMSYNDCLTIRSIGESTVFTSQLMSMCLPELTPQVIWGGLTGEGDFNGGINDWTVDCGMDTCWYWEADGYAGGSFTDNYIFSPTVCNGAMVFSSDLLDNGGMFSGTIGAGTGGCAAPCFGSLISPNINLSNIDIDFLELKFHQHLPL